MKGECESESVSGECVKGVSVRACVQVSACMQVCVCE